ncbi:hypothetical protein BT93_G0004 [Corymbia citriodora subsp. variegata]|nr:hypothetical protein BT93_G0004 [Corymbia citriodora subsp. variegata]
MAPFDGGVRSKEARTQVSVGGFDQNVTAKEARTQVSVDGFDQSVTGKELKEYLEEKVGLIWRCRLKTSWTPPDSYPNFVVTSFETIWIVDGYRKVESHAFVHFASPEAANSAHKHSQHDVLFLNNKPLKINPGPDSPFHMNQRRTIIPFKIPLECLEIGILITPKKLLVGWRGPHRGFCFTRRTAFSFQNQSSYAVINCEFKMEFLVRKIDEIRWCKKGSSTVVLLQLASPPHVYYRTADDNVVVSLQLDLLDDEDPWIRTTDFTASGAVGRCNTYRVSVLQCHWQKLMMAINYLRERKKQEFPPSQPLKKIQDEPNFGSHMGNAFFSIHREGIDFDIMFLLNAVIHKNVFSQHQLSDRFFKLLTSQPKEVIIAALQQIWSYECPVFDACKELKSVEKWLLKNPKLLDYLKKSNVYVEIRRLVVTPTKVHFLPPEMELSNRVLQNHKDVADRFLRVTFMDEGLETMSAGVLSYYAAPILKDIKSHSSSRKTKIFERVSTMMTDGINFCGRKYSFLAFSSNQLRSRSAWFFAEDRKKDVKKIREWMGKFYNKNVAKCAARMGLCFSSTYETVKVPREEVRDDFPDIERNGYCFSDGIGMITPDLARKVAAKLKLEFRVPSAYQIRYAGYKGVVACWERKDDGIQLWPSKDDGIQLSLRPSMNKFQSEHTTLEICSWTRFQPAFLNREIVTLLSTLKVSDKVFQDMQEEMVSRLNQMLDDSEVALDVLTSSCAEQGNSAVMMLRAGFRPESEPHLRGMLMCIRAAQLWGLREKARIFVPSGRFLMGCLDELGVLEQGHCFIQVSSPATQKCFIKHDPRFSETKENPQVIEGYVVVAKNPCLHPGDIRILKAIDAPKLHHLYDCLVFPQNGERPHADEASGSDLDGDLYFVTWEENIIPPSKESWPPMQYDSGEEQKLPRDITQESAVLVSDVLHLLTTRRTPESVGVTQAKTCTQHKALTCRATRQSICRERYIIAFFVKYIGDDRLGTICNAHVVHADRSERGALDKDCIQLAKLAATAVDAPKTGKIVTMPHRLNPEQCPDFMGKEEFQTYKSTKILGGLYHRAKDACCKDLKSFKLNHLPKDVPYDASLEVQGGLLAQYKVNNEEELVTGHVWSMPKYASHKQRELKERLEHSYAALRNEFREKFKNLDPNSMSLKRKDRNLPYEQKASAWYQVTYHPEWVKQSVLLGEHDDGGTSAVMLSFAWIAIDYLAPINFRNQKGGNLDSAKPINSLSK